WGIKGGGPGALGEYILVKGEEERRLPSKCTVSLGKGDTLIIRTPGGGGYGDPLERPPDMVMRDVLNGLVSTEAAKEQYGVVLDVTGKAVSMEETEQLRQKKRGGRSRCS
ncbi:MAG: hydantoinase B/oxoprolinase family protein, partial [Candidatus Bathyarchaeota archaeon]